LEKKLEFLNFTIPFQFFLCARAPDSNTQKTKKEMGDCGQLVVWHKKDQNLTNDGRSTGKGVDRERQTMFKEKLTSQKQTARRLAIDPDTNEKYTEIIESSCIAPETREMRTESIPGI
jgi:hypothetical protein